MMSYSYQEAVISFIDILGFKSKIQSEQASAVGEVLGQFRESLSGWKSDSFSELASVALHSFSDNVVRIRVPSIHGSLYAELDELAHIQYRLFEKSILIRGGIVFGKIYSKSTYDKNIVFGPGLIDAHCIESCQAVFPRILVSDSVFQAANMFRSADDNRDEVILLNAILLTDSDGHKFIDYLGSFLNGNPEEGFTEFHLQKHRNIIIALNDALRDTRMDPEKVTRVGAKMHWLLEYHNRTVGRFVPRKSLQVQLSI